MGEAKPGTVSSLVLTILDPSCGGTIPRSTSFLSVCSLRLLAIHHIITHPHRRIAAVLSMSREAYVAPALQPQASITSTAISDPTTQYLCGECNAKVQLKKGDPIRCKDCGHRVLYKERTKRCVKFNLILQDVERMD